MWVIGCTVYFVCTLTTGDAGAVDVPHLAAVSVHVSGRVSMRVCSVAVLGSLARYTFPCTLAMIVRTIIIILAPGARKRGGERAAMALELELSSSATNKKLE